MMQEVTKQELELPTYDKVLEQYLLGKLISSPADRSEYLSEKD